MTTIDSVRPVTAEEQQRAIQTLTLAFGNDPFMRWVLPDPATYLDTFGDVTAALAGAAFEHGTAYCAGDFVATALWLPPDVHGDEERLVSLISEHVPAARQAALFEILERLDECHPVGAHWYLPLMGVDPRHQGCGYGSSLLQRAVEACDTSQRPAYLESSNPRNIPLYERFGFDIVGEIQVGNAPPLSPMIRAPR